MEEKLEKQQFQSERILKKYEKLNNQVLFLQREKSGYKIKGEKIKIDLGKCNRELNSKEKKLNGLGKVNNDYSLFIGIKNEINNVISDNYYYENKINEYKNKNEKYLDKIKNNKSNKNLMLFMIYFQFILIICILIVFCVFHNKNNRNIKKKSKLLNITNFRLLINNNNCLVFSEDGLDILIVLFTIFKNAFGFNIYIFFLQYSNLFLYICRNDLGHKIKILIYKKKLNEINDYFERISKYKKLYATFNIHI